MRNDTTEERTIFETTRTIVDQRTADYIDFTLFGVCRDGRSIRLLNDILKIIDGFEDATYEVKVVAKENGYGGAAGAYFRAEGAARNVRPMLAAVAREQHTTSANRKIPRVDRIYAGFFLHAQEEVVTMADQDEDSIQEIKLPPCGMIFEFKELEQAKAFADTVKKHFGLGGRVFDDADAAAASHFFPWVQIPPVVHIDRPYWKLPEDEPWPEAIEASEIERRVMQLAGEFGGRCVGT